MNGDRPARPIENHKKYESEPLCIGNVDHIENSIALFKYLFSLLIFHVPFGIKIAVSPTDYQSLNEKSD